jgi:hypothetical protein
MKREVRASVEFSAGALPLRTEAKFDNSAPQRWVMGSLVAR